MISVLICSIKPTLLSQITANIELTIGTDYEILHYDNRIEKKGICQVYNELALKARFPYLCFVHEDVLFTTNDWGKKLLVIFSSNSAIGLVGVAGSKYKSRYFSGWYNNIKQVDCQNIVHRNDHVDESIYLNPDESAKHQEVVCIDGVFMNCTKEVWRKIRFNEQAFKGFHFYDVDFSLKVAFDYTVIVTYEINIVHITKGSDWGNNWVQNAFIFHELYYNQLPYQLSASLPGNAESIIIKTWLDWLKKFKITFKNRWKWIFAQKLYQNPDYYYSILKFLLYDPLSLKYLHKLLKKIHKR